MSGRVTIRWTPEAKARVCALYRKGVLSGTAIAAVIRSEHGIAVSKSSVIGIAFRAGLSDRVTQEARARIARPKQIRATRPRPRVVAKVKATPAPKPKSPYRVEAGFPVSLRIQIWEARADQCRFIADDPRGGAATYCGHSCRHGSPWCPVHFCHCTQPERRPVWVPEHRRAA